MTESTKLPPGQNEIEDPWKEVVLILGGRSGKSRLSAGISAYESCCTEWNKYVDVRRGELAWTFVMATREKQAQDIGRNMIFQMLQNSPQLSKLIVEEPSKTQSKYFPYSKSGVLVLSNGCGITALPCSSKVGRGYPIGVFLGDEIAWFARESKDETTDQGIYDSVLPRQVQFQDEAKMILITTPADKSGLIFNKWKSRKKNQDLYLCLKIPTWKVRTDFRREDFERHRKLSPLGFSREYGAEFQDALDPLLKPSEVDRVLRSNEKEIPPEPNKYTYQMAIDAAFGERDRFAVAVGHVVQNEDKPNDYKVIIDVAGIVEEDLEHDFVVSAALRVRELYFKYAVFECFGDQYQSDAFGKILDDYQVELTAEPWTAPKHRLYYGRLRSLIKQRKISLPCNDDMVDELLGLQVKYLPNSGQYTITHKVGGHDDISDAIAEVTYRLTEDEVLHPSGIEIL